MTEPVKLSYSGTTVDTLLSAVNTIESTRNNTGSNILYDDLTWSNTIDGGTP